MPKVRDDTAELLSWAQATATEVDRRGFGVAVGAQRAAITATAWNQKVALFIEGAVGPSRCEGGRDRLFELLDRDDLLVKRKRLQNPRTTSSGHYLRVYGNKIKELIVKRPDEVWVSDLTYVRTMEGFIYVALITDKCSRKIVGYHCGDTLESISCVKALEMALAKLPAGDLEGRI